MDSFWRLEFFIVNLSLGMRALGWGFGILSQLQTFADKLQRIQNTQEEEIVSLVAGNFSVFTSQKKQSG